jgi:pyridoxine/pyridoxamine 5'-phosphate oxidase
MNSKKLSNRFTIRTTPSQFKAYQTNQAQVFAKIRQLLDTLAEVKHD